MPLGGARLYRENQAVPGSALYWSRQAFLWESRSFTGREDVNSCTRFSVAPDLRALGDGCRVWLLSCHDVVDVCGEDRLERPVVNCCRPQRRVRGDAEHVLAEVRQGEHARRDVFAVETRGSRWLRRGDRCGPRVSGERGEGPVVLRRVALAAARPVRDVRPGLPVGGLPQGVPDDRW